MKQMKKFPLFDDVDVVVVVVVVKTMFFFSDYVYNFE